MCFDSAPQTTTVQQQSSMPAWAQGAAQNNYNRSVQIANRAFPTFQGPRIADFSAPQQQAFGLTQQNVGSFKPSLDMATAATQAGGRATPDMDMSRYMDPFRQNVIDTTVDELNKQAGMQNAAVDRQLAARKAFGSSGDLLKSEVMRNQDAVKANTVAGLNSQGWGQALATANSDAQRALAAGQQHAGIGTVGSQLGYQDAAAMQGIGTQQQNQTQRGLDLAVNDFEREFNYPVQNLNLLMSALSNTPLPRDQTQTTVGPGGSPVGQALGSAATVAGLGGPNGVGWWGRGSTGGPFGMW